MTDPAYHQLITDLARDLIAQTAPQELPIFRANSEAYFKDPEEALKGQASQDDMLGFGPGVAMTFLTPVALAVTSAAVEFLVDEVTKSVKKESADVIGDTVKSIFKKLRSRGKEGKKEKEDADDAAPPPLTPEQLEKVRQLALEKALQLDLSEDKADLLVDSLVGSLVE